MLTVTSAAIEEVKVLTPMCFTDKRGFFFESYNKKSFDEAIGTPVTFVQDNRSQSKKYTLRGLHYQVEQVQGKLIYPLSGILFDVAVDLRKGSKTFGKFCTLTLNASDHSFLWVPPGFAHGFLALSDTVDLLYKTTDYYNPKAERCLKWDFDSNLKWPLPKNSLPHLSDKDKRGHELASAEAIIVK